MKILYKTQNVAFWEVYGRMRSTGVKPVPHSLIYILVRGLLNMLPPIFFGSPCKSCLRNKASLCSVVGLFLLCFAINTQRNLLKNKLKIIHKSVDNAYFLWPNISKRTNAPIHFEACY